MTIKSQREAAEKQLGIEQVYQDALNAKNQLDETLTQLAEARDKKRDIERLLAECEVQVIEQTWANHSDLAQVRLDKLVKNELVMDNMLKQVRAQLASITSDIEGLEFDRQMHETTIKIATARMNELGGYLTWLTALMTRKE